MTTIYTAICERADDWWEITVPELESGRVTQAKSLDDVEDTVRDLVVLMTDVEAENVAVEIRAPDNAHEAHVHSERRRHGHDAAKGIAVVLAAGAVIDLLRRFVSRAADHIPHQDTH